MEIYYGRILNSISLIFQLAKVHICDWLTKGKQIYEPSCRSMHASALSSSSQNWTNRISEVLLSRQLMGPALALPIVCETFSFSILLPTKFTI